MVDFGFQSVYDWLVLSAGTPISAGSTITWGMVGVLTMILILWLKRSKS